MEYLVLTGEAMENNSNLLKLSPSPEITLYQSQLGPYANLNHLIVCNETNCGAIVDPFSGDYWINIIEEINIDLKMILLTHTHSDHVGGVHKLMNKYPEIEVWVHAGEDNRGWKGPDTKRWNHSPNSFTSLNLGELEFEIHCTPGHSPGHVSFVGHGTVIAGDLLFLGRCGRTDLYGGNKSTMFSSLMYFRDCLLKLPSEWLVFPGHQYPLDDGSNPMHICVGDLLQNNRSILEQSYEEFCKLEFLEFDDSLSVK